MSSISVRELKSILEECNDDYEVLFEIKERVNGETKKSIAYINGVKMDDEFREVVLMN